MTMLPLCSMSTSWGRFDTIARAIASGLRLPWARKRITDGFDAERVTLSFVEGSSSTMQAMTLVDVLRGV